jgi:hypothetical protein
MEESSAGKYKYGGKGTWVKHWARLGCWISPRCGPFSLRGRFETYEPFIALSLQFFFRAAVKRGYWTNRYGGTTVIVKSVAKTLRNWNGQIAVTRRVEAVPARYRNLYHFLSANSCIHSNIQGDQKSLCTWWLQYRKLQVIFKSDCLGTHRQGHGDTRLTLTPFVIPNCNYVIMVSDWNGLKYFVCFYIVIIRCTETFWSPCKRLIIRTTRG